MRNVLFAAILICGACVESTSPEPVPAAEEDLGKADGADQVCQYDWSVRRRAEEMVAAAWAPMAPKFPSPSGPEPYYWRVVSVPEAGDAGFVVSVHGTFTWGIENNYSEQLVVFDADGAFVRAIPGRYIAHLTTDRYLLSASRAEWQQTRTDRDPFYRAETLKVVRPDGEIVQVGTIRGNVIDSCGGFTRGGGDIVWNGRCDDNRDSVVVFRPYPQTGTPSRCPISI